MGEIIKFPSEPKKFGYKRVRGRKSSDDPGQLPLFSEPTAPILDFAGPLSAFEQALMLDERGDVQAADLYAKAIEVQDSVADAYCNLGIIESQRGNTAKAIDNFTAALKHNPRHSEAHYNLANLYFEVNDFSLAQVHYEVAGEVDPTFANVYFNLALVQSIVNDFSGAIISLRRYQQLAPATEARCADELLQNIRKSLASKPNAGPG